MLGFKKKTITSAAAPDFMPVLSGGAHASAETGACFMEYISVLAGEKFSDSPACVNPFIASVGRRINDMGPSYRSQLYSLMGPAMATGVQNSFTTRDRGVYLRDWSEANYGYGYDPTAPQEAINYLAALITEYHRKFGTTDHIITTHEVARVRLVGLPA